MASREAHETFMVFYGEILFVDELGLKQCTQVD